MLKVTKAMIEDVVSQICGADAVQIVLDILGKVNVSEFIIAEDLGLDIRELRRRIYKLWEAGFVYFKRKKDKKRGWYIYYWTFIPSRVLFLYRDLRKKRLEMLKERLEKEENNNFYICPNGCVRLDFSRAVEFDFKCPECGTLLVPNDNTRTIEHLKEEIKKLEQEIREFDKKIKEEEKLSKKKLKSSKKEPEAKKTGNVEKKRKKPQKKKTVKVKSSKKKVSKKKRKTRKKAVKKKRKTKK